MTPLLNFDRHCALIENAAHALVERCLAAGPDTPVPTCPEWSVQQLLAHQGMVHRWAAGNLHGVTRAEQGVTDILAEVGVARLNEWFLVGVDALLQALREADPDVEARVFLNDAPRPRDFWARRQAHETTIHSVDALAATLGRFPTAAEAALPADVAADGLDELLCGFLSREQSSLYDGEPATVLVAPTNVDHRWTLYLQPDSTVVERAAVGAPDATLTGTAVGLYLGLWNRGEEVGSAGRLDVLEQWRAGEQIHWGGPE